MTEDKNELHLHLLQVFENKEKTSSVFSFTNTGIETNRTTAFRVCKTKNSVDKGLTKKKIQSLEKTILLTTY